jgi:hypothetical protein
MPLGGGYAGFVLDENDERETGHHLGTVMVTLPEKGEARRSQTRSRTWKRSAEDDRTVPADGFPISVRAPAKTAPSPARTSTSESSVMTKTRSQGLADACRERSRKTPIWPN